MSGGAARLVRLRQSSCMKATPVVEVMHILGPERIIYVYHKILNGFQIQIQHIRASFMVRSIRRMTRF